jgi:hypothetical protein
MYTFRVAILYCFGLPLGVIGAPTDPGPADKARRGVRVPFDRVKERVYSSPSEVYSLHVDPEQPRQYETYAYGGACYRFNENGKALWSACRPYRLRGVSVTNTGFVAGVAYTKNETSFAKTGLGWEDGFHVVVIDREGNELLHDVRKRPRPSATHTRRRPFARRVLVNEGADCLFVSVEEHPMDSALWIYSMRTGDLLQRYDPEDEWTKRYLPGIGGALLIRDLWMVEGTRLVLVHSMSMRIGEGHRSIGAYFALLDVTTVTEVWSLALPDDYTVLEQEINRDPRRKTLWTYLEENPAILPDSQPAHFSLRYFVENKRVKFSVRSEGDSWVVSEISRIDYEHPRGSVPHHSP